MDANPRAIAMQFGRALRSTCSDPLAEQILLALLELLVQGEPVAVEEIAAFVDRKPAEVSGSLRKLPDIEMDEDGRVVGSGITLNPTPHRFVVAGRRLFTWCAWDTLTFPLLLNRTAQVESTCAETGEAISLVVSALRIEQLAPKDAVISLVIPSVCSNSCGIRGSFCDHVHFYRSAQDGQKWLDQNPTGHLLSVEEAFTIGAHVQELSRLGSVSLR